MQQIDCITRYRATLLKLQQSWLNWDLLSHPPNGKGLYNIAYIYSAQGEKLAKKKKDNTYQYYAGSMVYNNNKLLDYLIFEEGLVYKTSTLYAYEYHLKDHLGNVRVTFQPNGTTTAVKQATEYYPFGMNYAQSPAGTNKYLYNGKEKQDDNLSGTYLDLYDYGARMYDPTIGRWSVIDGKAEKYQSITAYAYAANNPVLFIDPDGHEIKVYRVEGQNGGKPTVVIQITGKLVNNSSTSYSSEQLQGYANRLTSSIKSSYTGEGESVNFRAEVNITVASDENKVQDSDHSFSIYDQGKLPGDEGNMGVTGSAIYGKKNINISQHILDRTEAASGDNEGTGKSELGQATLERTGAHELGHSATLDHPATGALDKNLMHQTKDPNAGKTIIESQVLQIEKSYNDNKLNK